jgi:hypothetical protein
MWSKAVANEAFKVLVCAGIVLRCVCGDNMTDKAFEASPSKYSKPVLTSCLILICGSCIRDGKSDRNVLRCSHSPRGPSQEISVVPGVAVYHSARILPPVGSIEASTKLKALITDLRASDGRKR